MIFNATTQRSNSMWMSRISDGCHERAFLHSVVCLYKTVDKPRLKLIFSQVYFCRLDYGWLFIAPKTIISQNFGPFGAPKCIQVTIGKYGVFSAVNKYSEFFDAFSVQRDGKWPKNQAHRHEGWVGTAYFFHFLSMRLLWFQTCWVAFLKSFFAMFLKKPFSLQKEDALVFFI